MTFPDRHIQNLFSLEFPIIQAPMAGSVGSEMVIAVSEAGGLGSLPCAMLTPEQAKTELGVIRQRTARPINVNFFCHQPPEYNSAVEAAWKERFRPYYAEFALDPDTATAAGARMPFDSAMADVVAEFAPEVVSFHFGLPEPSLVERVRATGAKLISSATSVDEARWLEDHGCDAIIAQGYEAGGHRGMFLSQDISTQAGTMALVAPSRRCRKGAGHRRRRYWGCKGHCGSLHAWSVRCPDWNGLSVLPGGEDRPTPSGGAEGSEGQRDCAHERFHRTPCSRDRKPPDRGGWPDVRACAGVPARSRDRHAAPGSG
jgi:hypothetical protein